ncbi:hypothetical protein PG997_013535 [Apiospora hydei]|uniref:Uncharacterized protein n=1 Tax=Apiospora hydei TaxID=1337664 RepID=A0ABR1V6H6_9PEZI
MSALGRISKAFYPIVMPRLFKRIYVEDGRVLRPDLDNRECYPDLPGMIRLLKPHLTNAQRKQLMDEGEYEDPTNEDPDVSNEWRPTGLGDFERPPCCNHVRQLIVGDCDGGEHDEETYVGRFTEEASRNWDHLEFVEVHQMTATLAENIAVCKNLKALKLCGPNNSWPSPRLYAEYAPLAIVKGLEHLTVNNFSAGIPCEILRSILGNSAATLRGLEMLLRPEGNLAFMFKKLVLPNLQSVGLGFQWDPDEKDMLDSLFTAVDFPKLTKLALYIPTVGISGRLTKVFRAMPEDVQPKLRTLVIEMFTSPADEGPEAKWRAAMSFISSFHTLTTLEIPNNVYHELAILAHKGLETLDISYSGTPSGFKCMLQSAETIRCIVSALPRLRVLKIAPEEGQMLLTSKQQAEAAKALANCANLESLTIIRGVSLPNAVLPAFLAHRSQPRDGVSRSGEFVWEEHYRLKRISNGRNVWEISSQPGTGTSQVEGLTNGQVGEARREVFVRDISGRVGGCDSAESELRRFEWIEAVAKDTSWVANQGRPPRLSGIDEDWESYIPTQDTASL